MSAVAIYPVWKRFLHKFVRRIAYFIYLSASNIISDRHVVFSLFCSIRNNRLFGGAENAGAENARVENVAPYSMGGKRGSGKRGSWMCTLVGTWS